MQWFRMYSEILQDPKVQRLPGALFKHWVNLLALANMGEPRGALPALEDVAFALRVKPVEADAVLVKLVERGLIDRTDDGLLVAHNWSKRQRDSDDSLPRVQRHRERKRRLSSSNDAASTPPRNVTGNVTETPPDTDSDTEREKNTPAAAAAGTLPAPAPVSATYPADFEEFWREYPRKTEKRAAFKAWKARLKGGVAPETLIAAARNYGAGCRADATDERYIKHPSTFLGSNRPYEEYIRPRAPTGPSGEARSGKYDHLIVG